MIKEYRNIIYEHYIGIFAIIILSIIINRNFFSNDIPAGEDMFYLLSRISFYSENSAIFPIWSAQSFGGEQPFILDQLAFGLTIINSFIDDPSLVVKILIISIFLFSGFSMYYFTYYFTENKMSSIFASIIFITNQFFISKFTSVHLAQAIAYSLTPLLFILYYRSLKSGKFKDILAFSFIPTILLIFTRPDTLIYLVPFIVLFAIMNPCNIEKSIILTRFLKVILFSGIIVFFLSAIILIPKFFVIQEPPSLVSNRFSTIGTYPMEEVWRYSKGILESITGMAMELSYVEYTPPYRMEAPFIVPFQYVVMSIIPIFSFSAIFFRKDRLMFFFAFSVIISIFLAKGPHPPFEELYEWMFFRVPYYGLLRIPTRWLMMTYFSYSFLSGISIYFIYTILKSLNNRVAVVLSITFIILTIIVIFSSSWYGIAEGLQTWTPPSEEILPHSYISERSGDSRVVTVPYYSWRMLTNVGIQHDLGMSSSLYNKKPVMNTGYENTYSSGFVRYTRELVVSNRTFNFMKILGLFDVKYLVIQGYFPASWLIPWNLDDNYQNVFFSKQNGLQVVYLSGNTTVYENDYWTPRIFTSSESAIIIGGREALTMLADIDDVSLSNRIFFFSNQIIGNRKYNYIDLMNKSSIMIFANSEPLDMTMLMLDNVTITKPYKYAYPSTNSSSHWINKDTINIKGWSAINPVTLSTKGENNITIPFKIKEKGNYDVWIRMINQKNVGELILTIGDKKIGSVVPYSKIPGIKWTKIGESELDYGDYTISIMNKKSPYGIVNDIDEIIFVKPDEIINKNKYVYELMENKHIVFIVDRNKVRIPDTEIPKKFNFPDIKYRLLDIRDYLVFYSVINENDELMKIFKTESPPEVSFTRIDSTKYVTKIKADKPFFLTLSDSYHPMWRAYGKGVDSNSMISYSFVNSFYINNTGDLSIDIEFTGQKYVWIGEIISITSFILAGFIFLIRKDDDI